MKTIKYNLSESNPIASWYLRCLGMQKSIFLFMILKQFYHIARKATYIHLRTQQKIPSSLQNFQTIPLIVFSYTYHNLSFYKSFYFFQIQSTSFLIKKTKQKLYVNSAFFYGNKILDSLVILSHTKLTLFSADNAHFSYIN